MTAEPMSRKKQDRPAEPRPGWIAYLGYLGFGLYFGVVLAKSEVISWFRIQEMFRFQSFHMYGVLGSAVLVAAVSLVLLRRSGWMDSPGGARANRSGADLACAWTGERIALSPKEKTPGLVRYWAGGTLFGLGWALLGACPGPLYVLIGHGETVYLVAVLTALAGTWTYGRLRERLPH